MIEIATALLSNFWPYIAGAAAILFAYFKGSADKARSYKTEDMENALDVHKRADAALRRFDGDTRPVDERLRDLGGFRDK